jgi:heme-degrading monooxygenase HmoA
MSVLMTLRITGDGGSLEKFAQADPKAFPAVVDKARAHGVISHHFYATADELLVVDEWPDEESFRAFYDASPEIGGFMQEAGVTTAPEIKFWRKLDLNDDVG